VSTTACDCCFEFPCPLRGRARAHEKGAMIAASPVTPIFLPWCL
jgi:hypothetical protein